MSRSDVNVCYGSNNIQNLFTFTGDGDMLKIGTLLCQLLHMHTEADTELCLKMATQAAYCIMGREIMYPGMQQLSEKETQSECGEREGKGRVRELGEQG